MTIHLVENMDEVLKLVLTRPLPPQPADKAGVSCEENVKEPQLTN